MLEITPALQSLLFYIFGIIGGLGIYIFKDFKATSGEKIEEIKREIERLKTNGSSNEKEMITLTSSLNNLVSKFSDLEVDFKEFMKTSQKAMERREEYHNHIEKISSNLMTQNQLLELLNKLDKFSK